MPKTKVLGNVLDKLGDYKTKKGAASKVKNEGKAAKLEAKAKYSKAKQASNIVGTISRNAAASAASYATAKVEVAKANAQAQQKALDQWNALINQTSVPAEGTGTAETNTGDSSTSSTTSPGVSGNPAR